MLRGKNAIITGARRGIGRSLTECFADAGYNIWACIRQPDPAFSEEMDGLSQTCGVEIKTVCFDLSDENEVKRGIGEIIQEKKTIDVLINNAGIAHGGLLTMTSLKTMRQVYEINVFAQVQIIQMVSRVMMRQKYGCIINMCSYGGIEANPGYLAYGSSKAAMIWITKSASRELGPYQIRVNGIAPGLIETEMGNYKSDEEKQKVLSRMSISRMGKPEEIAKAALYLASDDAAFMTGEIMVINGGRQ